MSRTDYIYSDKLSLELFREGKRPVDNGVGIEGLLFINTKPTGSTKLAIRPNTGEFTLGEQLNQNPSAGVDTRTKYLLFCDNVHTDPIVNCDNTASITNPALLDGNFMLEKFGILDTKERTVDSLLKEIENDPNLVVLYDHPEFAGYSLQTFISPSIIVGASNVFYIELDGVHINAHGENLVEALLKYGDGKRLLAEPYSTNTVSEVLARTNLTIENRDSVPHTLYIRYVGNDEALLTEFHQLDPLLFTDVNRGYKVDPDGLGIKITFSAQHKAFLTILPWFQYSVGGDAIVGNRYVVEVNGVPYRDTRKVDDLSSPTASLESVVLTNPALANLISISSGGEYNEIVNLTTSYLDVKIYLDEISPYSQNNKTVDTGTNPAGIYKKLNYPYGSTIKSGTMRKVNTNFPSVFINVTESGYSFRLGPNRGDANE